MQKIFDTNLWLNRLKNNALRGQTLPDFLLSAIAEDLTFRLSAINKNFERGLSVSFPDAELHEVLSTISYIKNLGTLSLNECDFNEDKLPLEHNQYDIILSCLVLQHINDLPGALTQLYKSLKPDGLLLGCILSGDTFTELRSAFSQVELKIYGGISPRIHPAIDVKQFGQLLQRAGYKIPVTDSEKQIVTYQNINTLYQDARGLGGNVLSDRDRKKTSQLLFKEIENVLRSNTSIEITYDLIWFSAWK